jgi:hypothetical protein
MYRRVAICAHRCCKIAEHAAAALPSACEARGQERSFGSSEQRPLAFAASLNGRLSTVAALVAALWPAPSVCARRRLARSSVPGGVDG